ncbi:MAG: GMC family oxidoreductase [Gemmatimonadetes bacterium]|nr:GMC family oxidoreductase [Gemmatimonadota bacterium]
MSQARRFDAIVVGAGMTGGMAAKELTEAGLSVLVLEAGRDIVPERDFVEHVPPYQVRFRGRRDVKALARDQFVQRECYACDEWAAKFFVNDRENPYTTPPDRPFKWIRGRQVGGRSIMWARQTYRWSDLDFEANAREGIGVDWPIRYRDLAPWYDRVERFAGISGRAEGLAQLPDGQFLPPMDLNCVEAHARERLREAFGGERLLTIGRSAVLTTAHGGRAACHYCGPCHRGCITRSYFSAVNASLPAARATGRLTLRPNSVVAELEHDAALRRVTGVRVIDAVTREETTYRGRVVFLCASTLESTRLLLLSRSAAFPTGLANSSGEVGRNLMDHTMNQGARGEVPGFEGRSYRGSRPNGIYIPRWMNVGTKHPDFVRGFGYQGEAFRQGWERQRSGFGAEFKRALIGEQGPWMLSLEGFGECLPDPTNQVALDPAVKDAWGIPALRISCRYGDNERRQMAAMVTAAVEMLEAIGARKIEPIRDPVDPGLVIHEMGTARMGRDPRSSVLNQWNQAHDLPNLFITDGACMTSSANQNPSLTYLALTARAAWYAVESMKRHEL